MTLIEKARDEWINSTPFEPDPQSVVLKKVIKTASSTQKPVVLLDLDSTLYDVSPRTFAIIKDWLASAQSKAFKNIRKKIADIQINHIGYSLKDTFHAVQISFEEGEGLDALKSLRPFWSERFFSNDYLDYDQVTPGAVQFVSELEKNGAILVYLTGRDEPSMGLGTRKRLKEDGFPVDPKKARMLLKSHRFLADKAHKEKAAESLKQEGNLIASFENEPKNLVAIYEKFPKGMHVFVESACSHEAAKIVPGLYRIRDFICEY